MRIEYVGDKPKKEDNIAATGTVWFGHGDVQDVADPQAHRLLLHPSVWRRAAPVTAPAPAPVAAPVPSPAPEVPGGLVSTPAPDASTGQPPDPDGKADAQHGDGKPTSEQSTEPKFVLIEGEDKHIVLDTMDDEALRAFAEVHGLKVDGRIKGDKLRAAIFEAATADEKKD